MVIGKGGETIRSLEADFEVQIDIEEDGTILVYATRAEGRRSDLSDRRDDEGAGVGDTYTGRIVKTTDFGAFVELKKGTDGLLHVSNIGPGPSRDIEDVIPAATRSTSSSRRSTRSGAVSARARRQARGRRAVSPETLVERAKDAPPREQRPPRDDHGALSASSDPRPRAAGRLRGFQASRRTARIRSAPRARAL